MGEISGISVGKSLKLVVENDERSVDERSGDERSVDGPSPGRTLYDNGGNKWETGNVRCVIFITSLH